MVDTVIRLLSLATLMMAVVILALFYGYTVGSSKAAPQCPAPVKSRTMLVSA